MVVLVFLYCFRSLKVKALERKSIAAWSICGAIPAPSQFLPVTWADADLCGQG